MGSCSESKGRPPKGRARYPSKLVIRFTKKGMQLEKSYISEEKKKAMANYPPKPGCPDFPSRKPSLDRKSTVRKRGPMTDMEAAANDEAPLKLACLVGADLTESKTDLLATPDILECPTLLIPKEQLLQRSSSSGSLWEGYELDDPFRPMTQMYQ